MRLFIAIELPETVRAHLESLRILLSREAMSEDVSWVKRDNWHVTLKFLGQVRDAELAGLVKAFSSIHADPMVLAADRMIYLPDRGPIRIVATGVRGDVGQLSGLWRQLEESAATLGFARENRPYLAHITIGRSRKGQRTSGLLSVRNLRLEGSFPGPAFNANEFVLMQSHLKPAGAEYIPLARFPLTQKNL